jgi:hypothetical protein
VKNKAWVKNPIDAFILAKLEAAGLKPALPADRRTLIRRAYFDLIGLPPPTERVEKFVNDSSPDAWEKLIDELLASPQYGERWARHWLDVARYADSGGYETDIYYRNAWRYRDYVVKSFNDDKPYNRFVQEQIAGDEINPIDLSLEGSYDVPPRKREHLEARIGTGFYALGPQIHESNMDGKRITYERLTDWADTTGSVFMGLTVGCARCHDHKFDPISQRDYYRLQAIFAASKEVEIPVVHAMAIASNRQHYPRLLAIDEARRALRLFDQRKSGADAKRPTLTPEDELERKRLLDNIANAVLALPEGIPDAPGGPWDGLMEIPTATVLGHEDPALIPEVRVLGRGELRMAKEKVSAGLPAVLAQATGGELPMPDRFTHRKQLALWLTRPDHPLTARVMVNRVWLWHFGKGIVATPNDFGKHGAMPTHPELLDWLATTFMENGGVRLPPNAKAPQERRSPTHPFAHSPTQYACGWSLKKLHKLIMLSSTYQQSSTLNPQPSALAIDPDNHLLYRMNRRRLEAEELWDAIHAVAGTLNLKMGGRPVVPPLEAEEIAALRDRWQWTVSADPKEHVRRGLYVLVRRNFKFPMFEVFDAPVNSVSCPVRDVSTVAPQVLWCLNNKTIFKQSQELAARLLKEAGSDPQACIRRAWQLALSRPPTEDEEREAMELLKSLGKGQEALGKLCLAVLNLNEFVYVD